MVHGDDYVSAGSKGDLEWLDGILSKAYGIQAQHLGPGNGCAVEGNVLNRIVRWTEAGWEFGGRAPGTVKRWQNSWA